MIICLRSSTHPMPSGDAAPRMVAQGRLVAIKGQLSESLVDALAAIPGVPVDVHGMSWALRVGPDGARSVGRVAEEHGVEMNDASRRMLAELCSQRDLSDPVVEVTTRDGVWLSLMEDWLSLAVEELRAVPGSQPRPAAARIEVPLTRWTAEPIERTISSHGLRLSPRSRARPQEGGRVRAGTAQGGRQWRRRRTRPPRFGPFAVSGPSIPS